MFELNKIKNPPEIWKSYRSLTLGRPVIKEQAYDAVYPWIEINGIYYHRSLETVLSLMSAGIAIPEVFNDDLNLIRYIQYAIREEGTLRPTQYGMLPPENNDSHRLLLMANEDDIIVYGDVNIPFKEWSKPCVYSNRFSKGADYVKPDAECIRLSQKYIFVCRPEDIDAKLFKVNGVNWNNVWVWEEKITR